MSDTASSGAIWAVKFAPCTEMPAFSYAAPSIREMFGNPTAAVSKHTWPLDHPIPAAFMYCALLLIIFVPASLRRYRARTSD